MGLRAMAKGPEKGPALQPLLLGLTAALALILIELPGGLPWRSGSSAQQGFGLLIADRTHVPAPRDQVVIGI